MQISAETIVTGVIGTVAAGFILWVGSVLWGKFKAFDKHIAECDVKNVVAAQVQSDVKELKKEIRWNGDCMIILATSLNTRLPDRPE